MADKLRADDSYPGALEVLPGCDSLDFVEWVMVIEEHLGEPVPDDTFRGRHRFTLADLMRDAMASSLGRDRKAEGNLSE